ncbi:MAG: hypothetical protein KDA28_04415 [Phycisphaerales bacterium]|nr:hypothetical protein [Phycisphaerales bacterium]
MTALACMRCRDDLEGLDERSVCPECSTPIPESLAHMARASRTRAEFLTVLRSLRTLQVTALGIALMIVPLVFQFLIVEEVRPSTRRPVELTTFGSILLVITSILVMGHVLSLVAMARAGAVRRWLPVLGAAIILLAACAVAVSERKVLIGAIAFIAYEGAFVGIVCSIASRYGNAKLKRRYLTFGAAAVILVWIFTFIGLLVTFLLSTVLSNRLHETLSTVLREADAICEAGP